MLNGIADVVRALRSDTTATVEDSDEAPLVLNDAFQIMEIAMLKIIDSGNENG